MSAKSSKLAIGTISAANAPDKHHPNQNSLAPNPGSIPGQTNLLFFE